MPDKLHDLTGRDLLEGNADLMDAAGALLAARTPRLLVFGSAAAAGAGQVQLTITTSAVASVDVYVNGRPVATTATPDGTTQVDVQYQFPDGGVIALETLSR